MSKKKSLKSWKGYTLQNHLPICQKIVLIAMMESKN